MTKLKVRVFSGVPDDVEVAINNWLADPTIKLHRTHAH